MYEKNLEESFRLRLSKEDMAFLTKLAEDREQSVSALVRSIIADYRRSLKAVELMGKALDIVKKGEMSNGDTESYINDKLQ